MLVLAHTGITLGAAALVAGAVKKSPSGWKNRLWHPIAALSDYLDIRLLIIGSLLPDIIDKPIGQYIFRDTFENGRIFAHTLLFLVLISAAGFFIFRKWRQTWLLVLAGGTFAHLVLDQMWLIPATLFWPLMGLEFPRIDYEVWISGLFEAIMSDPATYLSEAIGFLVLVWFVLMLAFRKNIAVFIRYGRPGYDNR